MNQTYQSILDLMQTCRAQTKQTNYRLGKTRLLEDNLDSLLSDVGLDSLAVTEFVVIAEDRFGVEVSQMPREYTVRAYVDLIYKKVLEGQNG